uniref:Delta-like protein n=1 Tax=Ciona intestinalis TaxID=7719 RepID=Q4H3Q7_CIOIN|nr:delta protein [Ciona intestinalis]BAE06370.1 delta protein [Ciona intestinalis]|eukprot:NP_001071677.1 delta protein [Ciona intestinalis]
MLSYISHCYVIINLVIYVSSEGSFQLKLLDLVNRNGVTGAGVCCSNDLFPNCRQQCRSSIRVCLKHYQAIVEPEAPCTFGNYSTPAIGGNSFVPDNTSYVRRHPIRFDFNFRWPGSFSMIVDILHEDRRHTEPPRTITRMIVSNGNLLTQAHNDDTWHTPPPYISHGVELRYAYRVKCKVHLYGSDCATHCHPRNDVFGHFTCDMHGNKVCMPGWMDTGGTKYCTTPICLNGCNTQRGYCQAPNQCICKVGWRGKLCNECSTTPGCMHGTCERPFQCNCRRGWGGLYCNQDLNYCTNHHPCLNGGLCTNSGEGSYTCTCQVGYIGRMCQYRISMCSSNPCNNGGECVDTNEGYKCLCRNGFYGVHCDVTHVTCRNSPCHNGGLCIQQHDHYECQCTNQWSGFNCEISLNPCNSNPCLNGGTCMIHNTGFKCKCPIGYIGDDCGVDICSNNPCLHGGTCVALKYGTRCKCTSGYIGKICGDIRGCLPTLCQNGGGCPTTLTGPQHSCICGFAFTLNSCETVEKNCGINFCNKEDCRDSSGRCECLKNFNCSVYFHQPTPTMKPQPPSKLIILNQPNTSQFNTTHWIAISFCVGTIVLILILTWACILYNRTNRNRSTKPDTSTPTDTTPTTQEVDTPPTLATKVEVNFTDEVNHLLEPEARVELPCSNCSHHKNRTTSTTKMGDPPTHEGARCPTYEEACEDSPCLP